MKNMFIGGAAIAGVAGYVNHVSVDRPSEAERQAYFADDPSAATPTYGGVLPGQRPLIREISEDRPDVAAHLAAARSQEQPTRQVARPSSGFGSSPSEQRAYGGIGDVGEGQGEILPPPNPLGTQLPNLSSLAPMGIGANGLTGIPELDEVMRRGAVGFPQMIEALRQSHARAKTLSPGNTSNYLLRCLAALADESCAPMRREVDVLHAEMLRIAGEATR